MTALLDTHILLRWFERTTHLSAAQRRAIDRATAENPLWVSDITLWEIATLHDLGRVRLGLPLRDWLEHAVAPPLVARCGISPAIATEATALPITFPRDPADRIITASARVLGATLLTNDTGIIESGVVKTL